MMYQKNAKCADLRMWLFVCCGKQGYSAIFALIALIQESVFRWWVGDDPNQITMLDYMKEMEVGEDG